MTQQSRITSLFGDLLEQKKPQDSQAVVVKQPIAGTADVQISSGEVIRRVKLVGSANVGDTITLRYTAGEYTALAAGAGSSLAGGVIVLGTGGSTGTLSGAPSPHDLLGIHHTLPVLSANMFLASPTGSGGFPSFRAVVPADLPGQFSGFGNPTATIGLTVVNGSATTAMRSDAAPALSQAITPTWTGSHTWSATSTFNGVVNVNAQVNVNEFLQVTKTAEQLRLRYDANNFTAFTVNASGTLTITPTGGSPGQGDIVFNPLGRNLLPNTGYAINIGSLQKKYLTLHVAELWVETLVAQDTIATIGGRILVCPTTTLTRDLAAAATTIYVKHNQMQIGDVIHMEANGSVEWMTITSTATTVTQGAEYSYTVTRNLDGTGANNWSAGDALANTGSAGSGFIDIYSLESIRAVQLDYIFNYDNSTGFYSANIANDSTFNIFDASPASQDAIYYGCDVQFDGVYHYIQTAQVSSGFFSSLEYWNGTVWASVVGQVITGALTSTGFFTSSWTIASQTGWAKNTVNGVNAYWVRRRVTGGTFTNPAVQGQRRVYRSKNTWGPTIAGMYRNSSTYSDIDARWVVGNLSGWYDYSGNVFGAAFGNYSATWVSVDATNGFRVMYNTTNLGQWDASGVITIGATTTAHTRISAGTMALKYGATEYIKFDIGSGSGQAYFNAVVTIATTGEIRQGSGTVGSNFTGIRLYNFGGIGVIAGYNTNVIQWWGDTDGVFKAGGGAVTLDANGIGVYAAGTGIPETIRERSYNLLDTGGGAFAKFSGNRSSKSAWLLSTGTNATSSIWAADNGSGKSAIVRADSFTPAVDHVLNGTITFQATTSGATTTGIATVTDAITVGSITNNYNPSGGPIVGGTGSGNGLTLALQGLDYTSIGFHDSGSRVDYIRSGAGIMDIGFDGGYGAAQVRVPGSFGVGVAHSNVTFYRLQVAGGIRSNGSNSGLYHEQRNNTAIIHAVYANDLGDGRGAASIIWNSNASEIAWFGTSGFVYNKNNTTTWNTISDARIKTVIGDYTSGLNEINKIKPVKYKSNGKKKALANDDKVHVGIVAQELAKVFPESVFEAPDADADGDKLLSINTDELIWALINAVKELSAQIDTLKAKVK